MPEQRLRALDEIIARLMDLREALAAIEETVDKERAITLREIQQLKPPRKSNRAKPR